MTTKHEREEHVRGWLAGRLPDEWFTEAVEISSDREEITIVGRIAAPATGEGASDAERAAAESGRIKQFREGTRDKRIEIASELEHSSRQKVAWGVVCGDTEELFTNLSFPVMTRLRQPERQVLDTLVDAGVARTRSEALHWCVKLVGKNAEAWLGELRSALEHVERVRAQDPTST